MLSRNIIACYYIDSSACKDRSSEEKLFIPLSMCTEMDNKLTIYIKICNTGEISQIYKEFATGCI